MITKNYKFSGPTPLRSEMSKIMEVFTRTAIPRDRLEGSPYPENAAMFISSIARTNLGMVSNKISTVTTVVYIEKTGSIERES